MGESIDERIGDYQSLSSQVITIGGGSAKVYLKGTSANLAYGSSAHVDLAADRAGIAFGSCYVMVTSEGVFAYGRNGQKQLA